MKSSLETRLGIFFALALFVAVLVLEMIGTADLFKKGYRIFSNFKNVQELKEGDPVRTAGVTIGRIDRIELIDQQARVTMKIEGKYTIKTDALAIIKFTGLMGQHYVSVEGGSPGAPNLLAGGTLESTVQPDLSTLMAKLEGVAGGVQDLTKSFSSENLSTLLGPVNDFIRANSTNLSAIFSNSANVTYQISSGQGTVGKLIYDDQLYTEALSTVGSLQAAATQARTLMTQADGIVRNVDTLVAGIQSGQGTVGKLMKDEALYKETTLAMTNLREALQKINQGQGSVGKLLNDDSLFRNAKLTLQKLDKATEGLEDQGPLSILGIAVGSLF